MCGFSYTGTLASDGSKFDSSLDRNQPFEFTRELITFGLKRDADGSFGGSFEVGSGQVIKGWDQGLRYFSGWDLGLRVWCRLAGYVRVGKEEAHDSSWTRLR